MRKTLSVNVDWIRSESGGRASPPFVGLRATIRWQRYIREWLVAAWDAEIIELTIETGGIFGKAKLRFSERAQLPNEFLKEGELIELLDANRVIGIGQITKVNSE